MLHLTHHCSIKIKSDWDCVMNGSLVAYFCIKDLGGEGGAEQEKSHFKTLHQPERIQLVRKTPQTYVTEFSNAGIILETELSKGKQCSVF